MWVGYVIFWSIAISLIVAGCLELYWSW